VSIITTETGADINLTSSDDINLTAQEWDAKLNLAAGTLAAGYAITVQGKAGENGYYRSQSSEGFRAGEDGPDREAGVPLGSKRTGRGAAGFCR
jgi:hypothetical protein